MNTENAKWSDNMTRKVFDRGVVRNATIDME
jgi:hypothetical protein